MRIGETIGVTNPWGASPQDPILDDIKDKLQQLTDMLHVMTPIDDAKFQQLMTDVHSEISDFLKNNPGMPADIKESFRKYPELLSDIEKSFVTQLKNAQAIDEINKKILGGGLTDEERIKFTNERDGLIEDNKNLADDAHQKGILSEEYYQKIKDFKEEQNR